MRTLIISLALAALTASGAGAAAQEAAVPAEWLGTWTLNVGRSDYGSAPAPYKRATYRIELAGEGFRVVYDMVHPRGGTTHLEWTGRMDGVDYPLQGVDQVITYAYSAVGDGSEIVVKIDGRVAARSRVTVSADGRTMTTRTTSTGAGGRPVVTTTVYEKL
jgi:hypothetical protein